LSIAARIVEKHALNNKGFIQ